MQNISILKTKLKNSTLSRQKKNRFTCCKKNPEKKKIEQNTAKLLISNICFKTNTHGFHFTTEKYFFIAHVVCDSGCEKHNVYVRSIQLHSTRNNFIEKNKTQMIIKGTIEVCHQCHHEKIDNNGHIGFYRPQV